VYTISVSASRAPPLRANPFTDDITTAGYWNRGRGNASSNLRVLCPSSIFGCHGRGLMKTGTGTARKCDLDHATVQDIAEPVPVFISPPRASCQCNRCRQHRCWHRQDDGRHPPFQAVTQYWPATPPVCTPGGWGKEVSCASLMPRPALACSSTELGRGTSLVSRFLCPSHPPTTSMPRPLSLDRMVVVDPTGSLKASPFLHPPGGPARNCYCPDWPQAQK